MHDSHVMTLADGRGLGWMELGDPAGWPVLGFHGTPGSRLQLAVDDAPIRAAGLRFVLPDRPGYGLSSFLPGRRLTDWPDDVVQLADHLGIDRFSVMGVSGGGPHAAVCAAHLADRVAVAGIVSGVGPLAGPASTDGMMGSNKVIAAFARRRSPILRGFTRVQVACVRRWPEQAITMMSKQSAAADVALLERPEVRALFVNDVSHASRDAGRACAQDFELFAGDWGFDLGAIDVPVHLWQGDADRNVPASHARLLHEAIPGSTLHEFPGEGHLLVLEHLDEIGATLRA